MSPKAPTFGLMAEYLLRARGYVVLAYKCEMEKGDEIGTFTILDETDIQDWNEQKRVLMAEFGVLHFVKSPPTFLYRAGKL